MSSQNPMLIIESGSTKSDWVMVNEHDHIISKFSTPGYNPFYLDTETILADFQNSVEIGTLKDFKGHIIFYGAGCSDEAHCEIVHRAFTQFFPQAQLEVNHDLLAAARSCFVGEPLLVGILGTGSNCCYFDGEKIIQTTPSLGFLLGDEGAGSHIGKLFVSKLLYDQVPKPLNQLFYQRFDLDKNQILNEVYHSEKPNTYLAQFTKFLGENQDQEFVKDLVCNAFRDFVRTHVLSYGMHFPFKASFVGSVAYHFQSILQNVLEEYGIEMGTVQQSPLDGLIHYHRRFA